MKTLHERIETTLSLDETFEYIADFANSQEWDPGVATARRVGDGPVGPGSGYKLGVRMAGRIAPMEYRITTYDPPHRVVLAGRGSNVDAVDDIGFEATPRGNRASTTPPTSGWAGCSGWSEPFLGGALERIGRDAADGMRRTLAQRAAARRDAGER